MFSETVFKPSTRKTDRGEHIVAGLGFGGKVMGYRDLWMLKAHLDSQELDKQRRAGQPESPWCHRPTFYWARDSIQEGGTKTAPDGQWQIDNERRLALASL